MMQCLNTNLTAHTTPRESIQLVTPIKSARKELPEAVESFTSQHRGQHHTTLVRTGCIPCLSRNRKCTSHCHPSAISTAWRINAFPSPLPHGTWRERKGLHDFVDLALAPQRLGLCRSSFWSETVLRLVLGNAAVFHVAAGIGALREHVMRVHCDGDAAVDAGGALAFALRQCNRAIALLTQAAREGTAEYVDPGVALVVCVLFTVFEALYGDPVEALTHVQQGRKILWRCEQSPPGRGGSRVIDTLTARPVLGGLQLQATCMAGQRCSALEPQPLDPLPLPDVDAIHSLSHASRILHVIYTNLLLYQHNASAYLFGADVATAGPAQKHLRFAPWLRNWERRFADFLFRHSRTLSHAHMQHAKVLKVNHLLCTILASVDTARGWAGWEPFTGEFKAILDLAAAVLTPETMGKAAELGGTEGMPVMSFELWIAEPLFVCLSRCTEPELRRQAAGLLNGVPRERTGSEARGYGRGERSAEASGIESTERRKKQEAASGIVMDETIVRPPS